MANNKLKKQIATDRGNGKISPHEIRLYRALSGSPDRWFTNNELASETEMSERTTRLHTLRFVCLGLLELTKVWPSYKYRWAADADQRGTDYLARLQQADAVMERAI